MKVLVVDDNKEIRWVLKRILSSFLPNVELTEAEGANPAKAILKDQRFDLIISDFEMPDGNGAELFAYLQAQGSIVPFILSSSHLPTDEMREHNVKALQKPYTSDEAKKIVASVLKLPKEKKAA